MSVYWGINLLLSFQCVCVHALFLSVHGLSLCIRMHICVVSVYIVYSIVLLWCAVDLVVKPAF